jgi:hypothetical protein
MSSRKRKKLRKDRNLWFVLGGGLILAVVIISLLQ